MIRKALYLEYFTVGWNVLEGVIAITAGIIASSIALVGFGLDSYIEVASAAVLIWRLCKHGDEDEEEKAEKRAILLVGVTFFVLALYVTYESTKKLILQEPPAESLIGLILAAVSLIVMPALAWQKRKVAAQMNSRALAADALETLLHEGMSLTKCRRCGCMKETLENLRSSLSSLQTTGSSDLREHVEFWLKQMDPIKYACLGCEYCFPAVAMNIFNQAFPEATQTQWLSCGSEVRKQIWPPVPGEYLAFCDGPGCPVAISTLASVELSERLVSIRPKELCIVGKTETENIGIDKVVKNTITNPTIRFLLLAGKDPQGHHSGRTLLALWEKGIDGDMRVIGSPGKRPILRNVTREEVEAFRKQVRVVDLMECEDEQRIVEKIKELYRGTSSSCSCEERAEETKPVQISTVPVIQAKEPAKVEMDKAGYFVIIPQPEKKFITMEHYAYDNKLLRVIEGRDARSIYWTIIENGWVTQLSHAAYLGKELAKAELSLKLGFKYVQDGA